METTIIRRAHPEDCERIFVLLQEFRQYENLLHKLTITLEACLIDPKCTEFRVKLIIMNPRLWCESNFKKDGFGDEKLFQSIVAETTVTGTRPNIIGYALFCYEYSAKVGKIMFMEDLFVQEPYRGNGIGTKLFKRLANIAVETGCKKIRWRVLCKLWNKKSMDFYMKNGAEDMSDFDVHLFQLEENALEKLAHV